MTDRAVTLVTISAMLAGAGIISFSLVYALVSLFIKDTQEELP